MNRLELDVLVDKVASILMERGFLSTEECNNLLETINLHWDINKSDKFREYLLSIIYKKAGECNSCDRSQERVYPVLGQGKLDTPMLVGDYPHYIDTLVGSPFTGMIELLKSPWNFDINKLESTFQPFIYPNKPTGLSLEHPERLRNRPTSINKEINLPKSFQSSGKKLLPLLTPGQVLDRVLLDIGINRPGWEGESGVYITNSVLCPSLSKGENKTPTVSQKKICKMWLDLQIEIVRPPIIIVLGNNALSTFFPDKSMGQVAGTVQFSSEYNTYVPSWRSYV